MQKFPALRSSAVEADRISKQRMLQVSDTYITGEIKHHQALEAQFLGLNVIEAGHYETERIVLQPLIRHLQALTNDVQYRLTLSEASCLARLD